MIWEKIERAEKHIQELEAEINAFLAVNPYRLVPQHDPVTGDFTHHVFEVDPAPSSIAIIFGDILNNLRATLDHLIYELVTANAGNPGDKWRGGFPIAESEKGFVQLMSEGQVDGIPQAAQDIIRLIQPYKGGTGHSLWQLTKLNNINKHRSVVIVGGKWDSFLMHWVEDFADNPFGLTESDFPIPIDVSNLPPELVKLKHGEVLAPMPAQYKHEREFSVSIAIFEPDVAESVPPIQICKELVKAIKGICAVFIDHGAPRYPGYPILYL
ncbi:MAG: hypothetical protein M3R04_05985 [bacterium]|nr:hypothetical protein [bacterium]